MEGFFVPKQTITPRFATLQYEVLHSLDISITEYFYLDMVYYLSRDSWCYKSLENVAHDMKMTRNGVQKMRNRLIEKGLLLKDAKGRVRSSVMYNKVYLTGDEGHTKLQKGHTKYASTVQLSMPKNNKENNKEEKGSSHLLEKGFTNDIHDYEARLRTSARKAQAALL